MDFISEKEYFEKLAISEEKLEYHDGRIVVMAGTQLNHNLIVSNLLVELALCLREKGGEILVSDMLVYLPTCNRYVFPDLTIVCEELEVEKHSKKGLEFLKNPKVVIEVLSKSTRNYDVNDKMLCYLKLKSLKKYILIDSTKKSIALYSKKDEENVHLKLYEDHHKAVKIAECQIEIEKIYRKIGF